MIDKEREEFEAWYRKEYINGNADERLKYNDLNDEYFYPFVDGMFHAWQKFAKREAELLARIAELEGHLQFVERWANHHGAKEISKATEILSVIQHYPPIEKITKSYADGVIPDTFNPFAEIERLKAGDPVVVIGRDWQLLFVDNGSISSIAEKHKLKVGSYLYASPVQPAADIAQLLHYPDCWDTVAYPDLNSALQETLSCAFKCSECQPKQEKGNG